MTQRFISGDLIVIDDAFQHKDEPQPVQRQLKIKLSDEAKLALVCKKYSRKWWEQLG